MADVTVNKREMARKANDRIRVSNPLDDDYTIYWDSNGFVIPGKGKDNGQGKGQAVLPRYVWINYAKHMTDKILTDRLTVLIKKENDRRIASGNKVMTKHPGEDSEETFSMKFKISDPDSRQEVMRILYIGLEEEYGMDTISLDNQPKPRDQRSDDEAFLDSLDRTTSTPEPSTAEFDEAKEEELPETHIDEIIAKKSKLAEKAAVSG